MNIAKAKMRRTIEWKFTLKYALVFVSITLVLIQFYHYALAYVAPANDWRHFSAGIAAMLQGQNPYTLPDFYVPPWIAILAPLMLLPFWAGFAALFILSAAAWIYTLRRYGASWPVVILFMVTPQLLISLIYGNADWLVALGTLLPPQIGLFLVLLKPQAGAFIALFWLVQAYRKGGLLRVVRDFAPVTIAYLLSFALFGLWPLAVRHDALIEASNISIFPLLIPVGLVLLYKAIKDQRFSFSLLAGPFLSPYVAVQSLPVAVLGLLPSQVETIIAILALWIVWLFRGPM